MLDSFAGMEVDSGQPSLLGRAETAGTVKCPLCSVRRQKRFARGRGLRMHIAEAHADVDLAEATAAIRLANATVMTVTKSELPLACRAARDGDVALLRRLRTDNAWDPAGEPVDKHGYRPVHWAAGSRKGCLEFCLGFVSAQVVDATTRRERRQGKRGGRSLLHWAARNGVYANAALLLAPPQNAPPNARTFDGTTPLMLALYGGAVDVAALLLDSGASTDAVNDWGCSDWHWAAMGEKPLAALQFLEQRCDGSLEHALALRQIHGHSVAHKLATRGHVDAARWLKTTFLSCRRRDVLRSALDADVSGRRPSQIASCAGFHACADVLRDLEDYQDDSSHSSITPTK